MIVIPLWVNADDWVWANQAAGWGSMRACHCHTKRPGNQALLPSSYMTLASGAV